jgi:putative sensory transduction regulator
LAIPRPLAARVGASHVDGWLSELGLVPLERAERAGATSWDLLLDGRRRRDVRVTLILEPSIALVAWVHYAPALNDGFRKSYRQFLRWNDELPFAKFALSADERPVLTAELPVDTADSNALGVTLARLLAICDLLLDDSAHWLWPGGRRPPDPGAERRNSGLFERYAAQLGELGEPPAAG